MTWRLDLQFMESNEIHIGDGGRPRPRAEVGTLYPAPYKARLELYAFSILSHSTWCEPIHDLQEPLPIVLRGGALDCYPWQGGHEAMLFLCATESRVAFDGRSGPLTSCLRPAIKLSA
jgi:hypothetical protein